MTLYQSIVERYPHTAAGGEAQKSAESLRAKLGVESPAPATASPLPPPQDAGAQAAGLPTVKPDSSRPNLEAEPPRQGPAPASARPWWKAPKVATGLTVAIVVVLGLTVVWIWPERKLARAKPRLLTDAEVGLVPDGSVSDGVEALKARAEKGDADAQYSLGWAYKNGEGVQQDYAEAVKWFRKAAEQGNALAQNNLGFSYAQRPGRPAGLRGSG